MSVNLAMLVDSDLERLIKNDRTLTELDLHRISQDELYQGAVRGTIGLNSLLYRAEGVRCTAEGAERIARALEVNHVLTSLNLADNEIGKKLVVAPTAYSPFGLSDPRVEKQVEWIKALAEALLVNGALLSLNLARNCIYANDTGQLAEALKVNRVLTALNLAGNVLGIEGAVALAEALKINRSLHTLDLNGCGICQHSQYSQKMSDRGCAAIAESLKVNLILRSLDLSGNGIVKEGVNALANALKVNRSLRSLILVGTLDIQGCKMIAGALKVNRSLESLVLCSGQIGNEGCRALADVLKVNATLRSLNLGSSEIGAEGGQFLARALMINCVLQDLSLKGNQLYADGFRAFAEMLSVNRSLTTLDLSNNSFLKETSFFFGLSHSTKAIKALAEALKKNHTLTWLDLRDEFFVKRHDFDLDGVTKTVQQEAWAILNNIHARITQNRERIDREKRVRDTKEKSVKKEQPATSPQSLPASASPNSSEKQATAKAATYAILLRSGGKKHHAITAPVESPRVVAAPSQLTPLTPLQQKHEKINLDFDAVQPLKQWEADSILVAAEKLQTVDAAALQVLQGHAKQLQRLFDAEAKAAAEDIKKSYIEADPALHTYFRFSARLLTGTWIACQGINSKMLANNKKFVSDYIASAFGAIGKLMPGAGTITELIQDGVRQWNIRAQRGFVQRFGLMFPDLESAFKQLGLLARELTLAQQESIKTIASTSLGLLARAKIFLQDVKAAILSDDINEPISRKAREDCQKIFDAIKDERPCPNPEIKHLLAEVVGKDYVYQPKIAATVQKLNAIDVINVPQLTDKSSEMLDAADKLQVIDTAALQMLEGHALYLKRLLNAEAQSEIADSEKSYIDADPILQVYYRFTMRLLSGTWIACQAITSKLIQSNKKFASDYFTTALNAVGKHVPVIVIATDLAQDGVRIWNIRSQQGFVQRLADLFPIEVAYKQLSLLTRRLTLAQEEIIKNCATQSLVLVGRAKSALQSVKAAVLSDDINEPISRKAREDCQKIFDALREGKPSPRPSVADLLTVIMGQSYVYQSRDGALASIPIPLPTPTPPLSPQTPPSPSMTMEQMMAFMQQQAEEIKRLKERDEAREGKLKALEKRLQSQDDDTVVAGDNEAQMQLKVSRVLSRSDAVHHSAPVFGAVARLESQVSRLTHQVTVVEARQQETEDTVAVTNARVDRLAKKKTSKT